MYQVFFNDYPLHDPRRDELQIREPEAHLAVGEAGTMAFTIDPDHPHADKLTRIKGVLKLTADGRPIFRGRIRKDTGDFYLSRRVEVEGLLACLNDSVIPPFDFPGDFENDAVYQTAAASGNVVQFFLEWVLTEHNSQVGPDQQIQLGTVTVADPNNYISRASSEYLTSMEAVKQKLTDLMGGYLVADYSGDTTVLHYYADLPLTNVQEVEFGENLLDLAVEIEAAETYTAILPIGKDGLTIEELEDGEISPGIFKQGKIIYSQEAEDAAGGRITRVVEWEDVTLATNLRTKAVTELTTNGVKHVQSIQITAADLGGTEELPRFVVGRYVRFKSKPHGFADAYPLMELDPDILNPGNTQIVLGATVKTSADLANKNQSDLAERQDQLQLDLNQQKKEIQEQGKTTQQNITTSIQTSEGFTLEALKSYTTQTEFGSYKVEVEGKFKLEADSAALNFEEVRESVKVVNGDLEKTVEKLEKHFDFSLENGLVIRGGPNDMSLRLDNGLILFEKNGEPFGWWDGTDFHTGNIVIAVEERAQFGNFAFVPRSNGSLSFLKVGG